MTERSSGIKGAIASVFPEKRIFIHTTGGARYLRLSSMRQILIGAAGLLAAGWLAVATAHVAIGYVASDGAPDQAIVLQDAYEARLAALAAERDQRAAEAVSAQKRFKTAMEEIGRQQATLLQTVEERRESESALHAARDRLAETVAARDAQAAANERLVAQMTKAAISLEAEASGGDLTDTLEAVTAALMDAVAVRDAALVERKALAAELASTEVELTTARRRHEEMIAEVRDAVADSTGPLEALLKTAEIDIDSTLALVRAEYSGAGGPLVPLGVSTRTNPDAPSTTNQFDELMIGIDRMNLLRVAVGKVPFAMPIKDAHRFTSAFGSRNDPLGRGRRMHAGVDFAAPKGTPIYATADGIVKSAKVESGYGKVVRIQHEFGFETIYAHLSEMRVTAGQRIPRGDRIGDMGTTGRSTGVHLHYEVRLNGRPLNPMTFVEAARDIF